MSNFKERFLQYFLCILVNLLFIALQGSSWAIYVAFCYNKARIPEAMIYTEQLAISHYAIIYLPRHEWEIENWHSFSNFFKLNKKRETLRTAYYESHQHHCKLSGLLYSNNIILKVSHTLSCSGRVAIKSLSQIATSLRNISFALSSICSLYVEYM